MLPDANHGPSLFVEQPVCVSVTVAISLNLPVPPLPVGYGPRSVLEAPVPVTAVHEHGYSYARECDIDTSPIVAGDPNLDSIPQSERVECTPQR